MDKLVWHTEKRKINDLIPYEGNPRQMTKKEAEDLRASLEKFNLVEIPAIDTDNKVIAGHQRLKILQLLNRGEEEIDVRIPNRKLTDEEFREYNLRSNKNLGEWNWDMLANFDEELLKLVGFETENLEALFPKEITEDEVPEIDDTPAISKLGEVYQLGRHRLMCGDATKKEDVEKLMDGKKADMVFTDPPYGIDYSDLKHKFRKIVGDEENPEQLVSDALAMHLGIPTYVCCNWQSMGNIGLAMENIGLDIKACIVWDKGVRVQNLDKFYKRHEFILYSGKFGGEKTVDSDIWQISRETRSDHPTVKPVELCVKAIKYSSKLDGLVLDMFGGSGSTLIACEQTNRICYMMEIDEKYTDVIRKRYAKFIGKEAEWQNITTKL